MLRFSAPAVAFGAIGFGISPAEDLVVDSGSFAFLPNGQKPRFFSSDASFRATRESAVAAGPAVAVFFGAVGGVETVTVAGCLAAGVAGGSAAISAFAGADACGPTGAAGAFVAVSLAGVVGEAVESVLDLPKGHFLLDFGADLFV